MVLFFFEHKTKMFYCLHRRLATPALSRTTVPPSPPKARAKPFSSCIPRTTCQSLWVIIAVPLIILLVLLFLFASLLPHHP